MYDSIESSGDQNAGDNIANKDCSCEVPDRAKATTKN